MFWKRIIEGCISAAFLEDDDHFKKFRPDLQKNSCNNRKMVYVKYVKITNQFDEFFFLQIIIFNAINLFVEDLVEQLLDLDQDHEHYLEELDDFEDDRNWYPMQDCHQQTNLVWDYNLHWHQGPVVQSLEVFVKLLELGTYLQRLE